jgi:Ca-activated chloride channel homolog
VRHRDVYPVDLKTDALLRVGQTVRATVDIIGTTPAVRVRLMGPDGQELASSPPIASDGRATIPLTFEAKDAGFLPVTVRAEVVQGRDADPRNNELRRTLAIQDPLRVLYLGDRMQHGAERLDDLLGRGFDVTDGSGRALDAATDLSAYDLVVVDDRPASKVPDAFQQRLLTAVQEQGLGLLFSGGKASFGTGGYDRTTIAKMLPVEMVQRTEKRDPSTALVVIIDTSGSMTGSRIELAKQVTRLAIRRLKAHDRVGIVEFYGNKHWALPLQSAANKITIDRAVGRMQAVGGTVLLPGVEEAYYGLKNVQTRYKHILIITDAGIEDADFEAMLRLVTKDGVNVSTVLVGAQAHNQIMIDMASWGKGRFYSAADRYALPEVILKQPATMKLPAYKTGTFSVQSRGGEGWWGDVDRRAMPALNGYVEVKSRPGADVLMEAGESADPLLTSWRYGLGRVTSLMTEPVGEGTQSWKGWQQYGRLFARIVSHTAADQPLFAYDVSRTDHELSVRARRYSADASLRPQGAVLDANGRETTALSFRELAPGQFSASLVVKPGDDLRLQTQARRADNVRERTRVSAPASQDLSPEHQVDPEHALDLEALAQATGGQYIEPAAIAADTAPAKWTTPTVAGRETSLTLIRLWPGVLLFGLFVYLADIIYRRWPYTHVRAARA